MTLILGSAANRKFVAMSSDKRRVTQQFWHDREKGIYTKLDFPLVQEEGKHLKIIKLSDYVLLGVGGVDPACRFIKEVMLKLVSPSDDLAICKKKLEFVIQQGRTEPTFRYRSLLLQENGVHASMMGFYHSGDTGNVTYSSGKETDISETITDTVYNWQYSLITPVAKYMAVVHELFDMAVEKRTKKVENIKKIKWIHKLISNAHPVEVSSDGVLHVITRKPDGSMKYSESEF